MNLLCVNFGRDSIYGLGWSDGAVAEARRAYVEYASTDTDYLETLPYDYRSPLGIFRGTLEMLMTWLDPEDHGGLAEHTEAWHDLAKWWPSEVKEVAHLVN